MISPSYENCGANHLTKNCVSMSFPKEQVNFVQVGSRNFNHVDKHITQERDNIRTLDGKIISKGMVQIMPSKRKNFQNQLASIKKFETQSSTTCITPTRSIPRLYNDQSKRASVSYYNPKWSKIARNTCEEVRQKI